MTAAEQITGPGLGDRRVAINHFYCQGLDTTVALTACIGVLNGGRQQVLLVYPDPVAGKLDAVRILGHRVQHMVAVGGGGQGEGVVTEVTTGDILVEKMGADKGGAFVTGRNALDQIQGRQVEPAIIVTARVLGDAKRGAAHIGGPGKEHQQILVAAVVAVPAQQGELASLLAALAIHYGHARLGTAVVGGVEGIEVGFFDQGLGGFRRVDRRAGQQNQPAEGNAW